MKRKNLLFLLGLVLVISCSKELFPDLDDYRDANLVGTWVTGYSITALSDTFPLYYVYTSEGYSDQVSGHKVHYSDSEYKVNYGLLGMIWNVQESSPNNFLYTYSAFNYKQHLRRGYYSNDNKREYRLSNNKDTLFFLGDNPDTLPRSKIRLNYSGRNFVDADTIR